MSHFHCFKHNTLLAVIFLCQAVVNLALGKSVSVSSIYPYPPYSDPSYAVDGRTGFTDIGLLFITDFELYPWLTIALGTRSIVKNVIIYNRNDTNGHWLHNVEIRGGISSVWSEMNTCGTFVGPSQTGKIHTIECEARPLLYVSYVTVKMVRLNYITDDWNARDGRNSLAIKEVVVNGLYV
ncbi:uncharacterized protein LOC133187623 [Saccostrea echinata]|uniref:uncharacterized protein LOC133187623 n=1 Tax=Saccostrea echinata TaxID=191078 RepID=UPI002A83DD9E|nr:uncharacterized protein LOC133187623 [Saccostrea echinata]